MDADRIISYLDTFSPADLHRIRAQLDQVIAQVEAWQQPPKLDPAGPSKTYQQEYIRCGKPACKKCTAGGPGHGPYWYAYWSEGGRTRKEYIGKHLPNT